MPDSKKSPFSRSRPAAFLLTQVARAGPELSKPTVSVTDPMGSEGPSTPSAGMWRKARHAVALKVRDSQ